MGGMLYIGRITTRGHMLESRSRVVVHFGTGYIRTMDISLRCGMQEKLSV